LARQLHDSMGSSLTALSMHLSLLATQMPQERALQDRVAQMKQLLQNVIESNREMQMKLWNDKLEFLGAGVALAELAARFGEGGDVTVRCSLPEDELDCPRAHGVALLRTLEEGLSNIAAHALASEVDIVVDDNEDALTLTVKDNGVGAPGAAAESGDKHGLRALRERLRYLGGNLTLTANAPRGSILTATLPKSAAR
ncbi:MAG TPA: histidine kinase, partial [Janthinobacterium sp.]|nr:histidine kinase [Janthinobacterium sp.]